MKIVTVPLGEVRRMPDYLRLPLRAFVQGGDLFEARYRDCPEVREILAKWELVKP